MLRNALTCILLLHYSIVLGQHHILKGTVRDLKGPVELVNVAVEGSSLGSITDEEGYYERDDER